MVSKLSLITSQDNRLANLYEALFICQVHNHDSHDGSLYRMVLYVLPFSLCHFTLLGLVVITPTVGAQINDSCHQQH